MKELGKYLEEYFGLQVVVRSALKSEVNRLPLYLKGNFEFFMGAIQGRAVVWAQVREEAETTPDRLDKQGRSLKELFNAPVIFVFDHLDAWLRKRLIGKKIAFIQTYKQLYIPEMLIDLNNVLGRNIDSSEKKKTISYPAQCALLYHLEKESLEGKSFQAIAEILHYSAMTMTRIAKELSVFKLAKIKGAKEKDLSFDQKGKDLWNKALPFFSTPVKEIWFYDKEISDEHLLESGGSALDEYSMVSSADMMSYAIGKEAFRSLNVSGKLPRLNKQYGDFKIEVWHYDPILLSGLNEKAVDRLSLYLSLQQQNDERVIAGLRELINANKW